MSNDSLPERLFHYCDLDGLKGIIETQQLWMTHAKWMDDSMELYDLLKALRSKLEGDTSGFAPDTLDRLKRHLDLLTPVFIASFSEVRDSLPQWFRYADDGHGFCIGFDPHAFELGDPVKNTNVMFHKVKYDSVEKAPLVDKIFEMLKAAQKHSDGFMDWFVEYQTWFTAPKCKSASFVHENEWRLVSRNNPGEKICFRTRKQRHLVPYVAYQLDRGRNPIREIRFGPRNSIELNLDAIGWLLRRHGYQWDQIEYTQSEVPLRDRY